ncbi:hypothetical protein FB451DRAFT_1289209 [Mycena latifolia]|nr:hypothetical protein FB451DRAFT_1289209 [Mycena latifolia]
MRVEGYSWDGSVYTGLRQFHQGKGFDADSQDVARQLGYPLYQLSGELGARFAHVEEEECVAENDAVQGNNPTDDKEIRQPIIKTEAEFQDTTSIKDPEPFELDEEPISLSRPYKLLMAVQCALILFLAFCWVCEKPWCGA